MIYINKTDNDDIYIYIYILCNTHRLHVRYIYLHNWVILFGQMLAPWSIWDRYPLVKCVAMEIHHFE